jgi:hypothetical protein
LDSEGCLRFFVDPELSTIVQGKDLDYIQSLLKDFLERANQDPRALFEQLSSLGVGPVATEKAGTNLADHPYLMRLLSRFVELK